MLIFVWKMSPSRAAKYHVISACDVTLSKEKQNIAIWSKTKNMAEEISV